MGKAARHPGSAQSTGDEVEGVPTAAEAVEDALAGGVQFVNPVDRGTVPGDVGGETPVSGGVGGAEDETEGGLGPPEEVQEPLGEGALRRGSPRRSEEAPGGGRASRGQA